MIYKTGYEWCLEAMIRILDLNNWAGSELVPDYEESYFREKITYDDFLGRLKGCLVKSNSIPRKTETYLEYRMYGLVPYNLSPIQQGIQFGHAVVEYGLSVIGDDIDINSKIIHYKWASEDKTFIILNGGTTNNNPERLGSLNQHLLNITQAGIKVSTFHEPDLGDQLTAFVFLVDERVYNRELYADFVPETLPWSRHKPSEQKLLELAARNEENYEKWMDKVGGPENVFLRNYLKPLRLA